MTDSADNTLGSEVRRAYHQELEELDANVLRLGAMVCEMVPKGTEVLLDGDLQRARELIESDDAIDQLALEIEDACYSIIARQAPKASELRHVVTVNKLVAELERSADLMINVCKATRRMYGSAMSPRIRGVVAAMSKDANRILRLSLDAFADADVALASALDDVDDGLDQLNRDMVAAIFSAHADEEIDLAAAVQLALIARYYERIGDHAVNIGERVTYMVTGWLPEHNGALRQNHREQTIIDPEAVVLPPEEQG
ncbi:MAG: phosphate signaling complex protein PhoU [Actinomycetota bacterium]